MRSRRTRLLSPTILLRRNAIYKGVFGGSRPWLTVAMLFWGQGLAKRFLTRQETVVATEVLKPGQILRLEALRTPTRRERRAAKRQRG